MKKLLVLAIVLFDLTLFAQSLPVNCNLSVPACPGDYTLVGTNPNYNTPDFGVGTVSNPSTNPGSSGNSGCLLSGETVSTFLTIHVSSSGNLQWSAIALDAGGNPSGEGCLDWIMWNVTNQPAGDPCSGIGGNTLPPVACNWNGLCNGNSGMAAPANYPPGASPTSYEAPLPVIAGQTYILCLSNYSNVTVNLDFSLFGTAGISCGVDSPDQYVCGGGSVTVTIDTPGYDNPEFTWLTTAGVSDPESGTDVTVTTAATATYTVAVYQDTIGGLQQLNDTTTFTVFVQTPVVASTSISGTVDTCYGTSIEAEGFPADGVGYQWLQNGNPMSNSGLQTLEITQSGIYSLVVENSCGIDTSEAFTVEMTMPPAVLLSPSGVYGICEGTVLELEAAPQNALTLEWLLDGVPVLDSVSETFLSSETGIYSVVATNECGSDTSGVLNLIINPLPDAPVIAYTGGQLVFASQPGVTYQWFFNGGELPGATNDSLLPLENGSYSVVATSTDGCTTSSAVLTIGNVGIDEMPIVSLSIAPNPSSGEFTVSLTAGSVTSLDLYDAQGKLVESKSLVDASAGKVLFQLPAQRAGVYFLRASGSGQSSMYRVVITN